MVSCISDNYHNNETRPETLMIWSRVKCRAGKKTRARTWDKTKERIGGAT